jgi:flagellar biosynthesis protein FlhF
MQLKKYEAPTIQEALKKIKNELGDNAVIFSSKTIRPKLKTPVRKGSTWVEVTAAIDRNMNNRLQTGFDNCIIGLNKPEEAHSGKGRSPETVNPGFADPICKFNANGQSDFTKAYFPFLKNLLRSGIKQDIAWHLIGDTCVEYNNKNNNKSIYNILLNKIASRIPVQGPVSVNPKKKKIAALIGPTGVGKTTTLAKIAAHCSFIKGIRVKIITMDTYRIAAAEQLKIYANIMGLPVFVVSTFSELKQQIECQEDVNLILIDTAGRNYRDNEQIDELGKWLNKYNEIESHLLLSSTTSEDVLNATINCFSKSRVDRLIITKVDESMKLGHIYNFIISSKIPLSYITTGQRVPEDIKSASDNTLARFFLEGSIN